VLPSLSAIARTASDNGLDISVYLMLGVVAMCLQPKLSVILHVGFYLLAGVLIIEQNFQVTGMVTLPTSALVLSERLKGQLRMDWTLSAGVALVVGVLGAPTAFSNAMTLASHTRLGPFKEVRLTRRRMETRPSFGRPLHPTGQAGLPLFNDRDTAFSLPMGLYDFGTFAA